MFENIRVIHCLFCRNLRPKSTSNDQRYKKYLLYCKQTIPVTGVLSPKPQHTGVVSGWHWSRVDRWRSVGLCIAIQPSLMKIAVFVCFRPWVISIRVEDKHIAKMLRTWFFLLMSGMTPCFSQWQEPTQLHHWTKIGVKEFFKDFLRYWGAMGNLLDPGEWLRASRWMPREKMDNYPLMFRFSHFLMPWFYISHLWWDMSARSFFAGRGQDSLSKGRCDNGILSDDQPSRTGLPKFRVSVLNWAVLLGLLRVVRKFPASNTAAELLGILIPEIKGVESDPCLSFTVPESNIDPENRHSPKRKVVFNHHIPGAMLVSGSVFADQVLFLAYWQKSRQFDVELLCLGMAPWTSLPFWVRMFFSAFLREPRGE